MKTKTIAIAAIIFTGLAFTYITNWTVDTAKSKVTFTANGPLGKVDGSFGGLKTNIQFDENNLAASSIHASIEVNTIETGIGLRNKDLRDKPEWFDAAKYPQLTIQSKAIKKLDSGYKMDADLTIKGVTKPVIIAFSFTPAGNGGLFMSQFTLNREDFGLGKSGGSVAKEVSVKLEVPVNK
jgi:polyisoprenoid-binding protein YceI